MQEVAPKAVVTGEEADETAKTDAALVADKPLWIFVTDSDATSDGMRKLEEIVFKNEDVGVGAKFFKCVRVTEADAARDRILKDAGRGTPRMIFLRRDYTIHSVVDNLKASAVLKAMKSLVAFTYESNFDRMTRDYKKLLNELDRLDSVRQRLDDLKLRVDQKGDASSRKKLESEQKEYDAEVTAWNAAESKLLALRRKGDKDNPA